jgi:ribosomal protein L35AE/L33A
MYHISPLSWKNSGSEQSKPQTILTVLDCLKKFGTKLQCRKSAMPLVSGLCCTLHGNSGAVRRRKGDLQIETAGIAVCIQDFSGKIQPRTALRFHSLGVDLPDGYTAPCDNGLINGSECPNPQGQRFYPAVQRLPLFPCKAVCLLIGRNPALPQYRQNQLCRKQGVEQVP